MLKNEHGAFYISLAGTQLTQRAIGGKAQTDAPGALPPERDSARYVSMEDFQNPHSTIWNNVDYSDTETQAQITNTIHNDMVANGDIVALSDSEQKVSPYYPDLRTVKKIERNSILKQHIAELKKQLRGFLQGISENSYEFEVNGNILDAKLYNTGISEVLEKVTRDKATMLYQSDEIFKKARYLYSTPDYDGNPNIYRWNYFYTPVQIEDDVLGVRIAVRDVGQGENHSPESQIYNWGLKKGAALGGEQPGISTSSPGASSAASSEAALDGEGRGQGRGSPGVSSATSPAIIIPQSMQNIKSDSAPVNPILQALEAKRQETKAKREAFSKAVESSFAEKRLARTDNKAVAPSGITDYNKNNYGGQTSGTEGGVSEGTGKLPQGLDKQSFETASKLIRDTAGSVSDDIVVQGSRAAGTATADSDIDFAIRVSQEQFDNLIKQYFKTPNPGSAAERTLRHAIQSGKIQSGEAKLSGLRKMLEKQFGMKVDISIILKGGPFDNGTTIRLP